MKTQLCILGVTGLLQTSLSYRLCCQKTCNWYKTDSDQIGNRKTKYNPQTRWRTCTAWCWRWGAKIETLSISKSKTENAKGREIKNDTCILWKYVFYWSVYVRALTVTNDIRRSRSYMENDIIELKWKFKTVTSWRTVKTNNRPVENILHLGGGLNADIMEVSSKNKVFHYPMS